MSDAVTLTLSPFTLKYVANAVYMAAIQWPEGSDRRAHWLSIYDEIHAHVPAHPEFVEEPVRCPYCLCARDPDDGVFILWAENHCKHWSYCPANIGEAQS